MRRKKLTKRKKEREEDITSQSSADEAERGEDQQFEAAEKPEQTRLRLAKKLLATARQTLGDDPFFTEETPGDTARLGAFHHPKQISRELSAAPEERVLRGHRKTITAVAFGPNGDVYTASKDCAILVFRKAQEYRRAVFSSGYPTDPNGHRDELYCLEMAVDGQIMASAGKDAAIKLWQPNGGHSCFIGEFLGHQGPVHALCFKSGRELVSLSADRTLKLWSTEQVSLIQTMFGHRAEPQAVAPIGPDSAVSVGYDRMPVLWRLERETQALFAPQTASLDCVAALNSQHFATGSEEGELCLWNTARRKPIFRLPNAHPPGWLSALAANQTLGLVAAGGRAGPVSVYRVHFDKSGAKLTRALQIPAQGVITSLKFSNDGGTLAGVEAQEDRVGRWNFFPEARSRIRLFSLFVDA